MTKLKTNPSQLTQSSPALRAAARSLGIQTSYISNTNETIWAPSATLSKLCECLGSPYPKSDTDALSILKQQRSKILQQHLPSSLVAWGGVLNKFHLQLEINTDFSKINFVINDQILDYKILNTLTRKNRKTFRIQIISAIKLGYHSLQLLINNLKVADCFIISAPTKLNADIKRCWGPFLPTYALRSDTDWGIGSITELHSAARVCKKYGANFISILPTLAGRFDNDDCDPSPYSALTRFFWNEIYLDVDALLKKYPVAAAIKLRQSSEFNNRILELRASEYVNYFKCYQLKKEILKILSKDFFSRSPPIKYNDFLKKNPSAQRYASFRSSELDEKNFHLFVQFEIDNALNELYLMSGLHLYMDYPVGVNDSGFDYFEDQTNFLGSVSVGAPPEPVFQLGQDWGFPAFHPHQLAQNKYGYFIESIKQHLKYSKILRLDHVIGLYRIYSVPKGFGGQNGAYIRFAEDDFFAIIVLEASIAGADIIGENLGTVPAKVNEILNKRCVKGMQILQLDLWQKPEELITKIDRNTLCALNTHDMPMFSRFLKGEDLDELKNLGILHSDFYDDCKTERFQQIERWRNIFQNNPNTSASVQALNFLAKSNCQYLVVNIEDLWNEERPQNIPGTWKEAPNWRRKMKIAIESWESHKFCHQAFIYLKELVS